MDGLWISNPACLPVRKRGWRARVDIHGVLTFKQATPTFDPCYKRVSGVRMAAGTHQDSAVKTLVAFPNAFRCKPTGPSESVLPEQTLAER